LKELSAGRGSIKGLHIFTADAEACVAALKSGDDEKLDAVFAAEIIL
jgi:hypothetical protein